MYRRFWYNDPDSKSVDSTPAFNPRQQLVTVAGRRRGGCQLFTRSQLADSPGLFDKVWNTTQ